MLGYGAFDLAGTRQHRSTRLTQPTWVILSVFSVSLRFNPSSCLFVVL